MRGMTESPKSHRSDGEQARARLLRAALELFVAHGFTKASIRDIAERAQANVSAIRYYFGDKAGLYRAVFTDPTLNPPIELVEDPQAIEALTDDLSATLHLMLSGMLEPLKQGELSELCIRLHYREMLEPTGMWQDEIETQIKPLFAVLLKALSKHLGVAPDEELYRLAFQVMGTAVMLHVGHDVYHAICPQLIDGPEAYDRYQHRLHDYAMAMVQAEASRRVKEAQAESQGTAGAGGKVVGRSAARAVTSAAKPVTKTAAKTATKSAAKPGSKPAADAGGRSAGQSADASPDQPSAQAATQPSPKSSAHPSADRPAAASPRVRRPRAG